MDEADRRWLLEILSSLAVTYFDLHFTSVDDIRSIAFADFVEKGPDRLYVVRNAIVMVSFECMEIWS